jgi:hypothetical protein
MYMYTCIPEGISHPMIIFHRSLFSSLDMWFRPTITGSPPPACNWCSLTRVDHHRAVLFGGAGKGVELISPDVYILDMNHWVSSSWLSSYIYAHPPFIVVNICTLFIWNPAYLCTIIRVSQNNFRILRVNNCNSRNFRFAYSAVQCMVTSG